MVRVSLQYINVSWGPLKLCVRKTEKQRPRNSMLGIQSPVYGSLQLWFMAILRLLWTLTVTSGWVLQWNPISSNPVVLEKCLNYNSEVTGTYLLFWKGGVSESVLIFIQPPSSAITVTVHCRTIVTTGVLPCKVSAQLLWGCKLCMNGAARCLYGTNNTEAFGWCAIADTRKLQCITAVHWQCPSLCH